MTDSRPVYDSAQQRSSALQELQELFRYRHLVFQLVRRDIVTRYKRSVLGIAWTMISPLLTMLILTVVFSQLFKGTSAYAAYVLSGLIAWNFFAQTTNDSMDKVVWGGGLLKYVYLPRTVLPVASMIAGLVNMLLALIPLGIILALYRVNLGWSLLLLPLPVILIGFFSLGVALIVSTLAVYFPDVNPMYQIILMAWLYLTPVIYPWEILPQTLQNILPYINPMVPLVKLFRLAIYEGRFPMFGEVWPAVMFSVSVLIAGWVLYSRKSSEFAHYV